MLFVLTGGVQTGKTRWLGALVERLSSEGVRCAGVTAPGVWRVRGKGSEASAEEHAAGAGEDAPFEKLGIDNVLLPGGERVPFARRVDLARADGSLDETSQAARAGLGWAISDAALARVNVHFEELAREVEAARLEGKGGSSDSCGTDGGVVSAGLLVVDELGRLELIRGEGLTAAMALLDRGPTRAYPHALAVARSELLPLARERFEGAWGLVEAIGPDEAGERAVRAAFSLDDAR